MLVFELQRTHIYDLFAQGNIGMREMISLSRCWNVWLAISASVCLACSAFFCGLICKNSAEAENLTTSFENEHGSFFSLFMANPTQMSAGYLYEPSHAEKGGPGEFDLDRYFFHSEAPAPISEDLYLRIGADYDRKDYTFTPVSNAGMQLDSETMHAFVLKGGLGFFPSENVLLTGVIKPGIFSDLDGGVDQEDADLYWEGMAVYKLNPGAQIIGGIARDNTFDDASIYPLLGIRLRGEDGRLNISLTFPREFRVGFNFNPSWELYFDSRIEGEQYRVNAGASDFDVRTQDPRLGVGTNYWIGEHLNLLAEVGCNYESTLYYETRNSGQFSGDLDPAYYLMGSLGLRF